jgi:mRNA interferase MazF
MVSQSADRRHRDVKRGEVWLVRLDPIEGSEIQKTRPCLIVSPPEINERLRTVIAAPMTTGSRPAVSRIPVYFQAQAGLILLEQIRTLDKQRLRRRLGEVDGDVLDLALAKLREIFEK